MFLLVGSSANTVPSLAGTVHNRHDPAAAIQAVGRLRGCGERDKVRIGDVPNWHCRCFQEVDGGAGHLLGDDEIGSIGITANRRS